MEETKLKEYVAELQKGNMSAFEQVYELCKRSVFYNIYALTKNHELSEDLLHDTFIKFLKEVNNINLDKSIGGYLMVISRNITYDYFKKHNRVVEFDEGLENTEGVVEEKDDSDILLERIKKILKDKEFEIFVLHTVNDMRFEEIAKIKHRPLGTILWAYNNAIMKIRKELADEIS